MAASTISAGGPVPAADLGVAAVVAFNPAGLDLLAFRPEYQRLIEQRAGLASGRLVDYSLIEFAREPADAHPPRRPR